MPSGAPRSATHLTLSNSGIENSDADRKHEKDDADFGHRFENTNVVHVGTRGERTENETREDIARQNGLTETPGQQATDKAPAKTIAMSR